MIVTAIYKIRNIVNGKFYVGGTVDARVRFQSHRRLLRRGAHHCQPLQYAWNKYGEEAFKFEVVEDVDRREALFDAEDRWLAEHHGKPHCYNVSRCADSPTRGTTLSDTHKARISAANMGNQSAKGAIRPDEEREAIRQRKIGNINFRGRKHTEESKAIMSEKAKGFKRRLGHTNSPEHRARISAANKGRVISPEHVEKIRRRNKGNSYAKGRIVSAEQRAIFHKAIIETTTGIEFESVKAAAEHFGINRPNLSRILGTGGRWKRGTHAGLHFCYKADTQA